MEKRKSSTKPGPKQEQIFKVKAIGFVAGVVMTLLHGYHWLVNLLSIHLEDLQVQGVFWGKDSQTSHPLKQYKMSLIAFSYTGQKLDFFFEIIYIEAAYLFLNCHDNASEIFA